MLPTSIHSLPSLSFSPLRLFHSVSPSLILYLQVDEPTKGELRKELLGNKAHNVSTFNVLKAISYNLFNNNSEPSIFVNTKILYHISSFFVVDAVVVKQRRKI